MLRELTDDVLVDLGAVSEQTQGGQRIEDEFGGDLKD